MPEPIEGQTPPNQDAGNEGEIATLKKQLGLIAAQVEKIGERLDDQGDGADTVAETKPAAPQEYTRAQLQAFVDQGKITAVQMEDVLDQQRERRLLAAAKQIVKTEVQTTTAQTQVASDIASYAEVYPAVMREGSEERNRVHAEYKSLVAEGLPENERTELLALRSVFGRLAPNAGGRARRSIEANAETGGRGDGAPSNSGAPLNKPAFKTLSQPQLAHYEKMIAKGIYRDWNAVETEITYKRKSEART